jgi:hypothetical protein
MTERPAESDSEKNQYESDENYRPQRSPAEHPRNEDDYDGNERADDRVRIEQPSGEEAPRA